MLAVVESIRHVALNPPKTMRHDHPCGPSSRAQLVAVYHKLPTLAGLSEWDRGGYGPAFLIEFCSISKEFS